MALFASHAAQPLTDALVSASPPAERVLLVTAPDTEHAALSVTLAAMGADVAQPDAVAHRSLDGAYRTATTDRLVRLPADGVVSVPAEATEIMDLSGQTVVLRAEASPRARAEAASLVSSRGAASTLHLMTAGVLFGALGLLLHRPRFLGWALVSVATVETIALLNGTVLAIEVPLVVLVATGAAGAALARRNAPSEDEATPAFGSV